RAQKVRTLIRRDFEQAFQSVDAIVCPTSPEPAFPIGERTSDPLKMYLSDIFTISANLAGICAISVPCGFAQINGKKLPVGLQFLCNFLEEQKLLSIANAYEVTTPWSRQSPPI
ncbi:MAG: amidase family protein, partial [Chthoniobacterales bacterium]|nr:amidase family protein [Chthoniobacterales bacterium]